MTKTEELLEAELEYWAGVLRQHGVVKDRSYIFKNKIMRLARSMRTEVGAKNMRAEARIKEETGDEES